MCYLHMGTLKWLINGGTGPQDLLKWLVSDLIGVQKAVRKKKNKYLKVILQEELLVFTHQETLGWRRRKYQNGTRGFGH